jgi:hypothetical protein
MGRLYRRQKARLHCAQLVEDSRGRRGDSLAEVAVDGDEEEEDGEEREEEDGGGRGLGGGWLLLLLSC